MKLEATPISGLYVAHTATRSDARGSFTRLFCEDDLAGALQGRRIVQINQSFTKLRGAIRGLHYQRPPHAEAKLVRCIRGAAWDVAVDLRANSPTFLRWHSVELTPENALMLVIPEGCAHGFQALSAETELLYLHTARYAPDAEAGVAWNDSRIGVAWPLPPPPECSLSERDRSLPMLDVDFAGVLA